MTCRGRYVRTLLTVVLALCAVGLVVALVASATGAVIISALFLLLCTLTAAPLRALPAAPAPLSGNRGGSSSRAPPLA